MLFFVNVDNVTIYPWDWLKSPPSTKVGVVDCTGVLCVVYMCWYRLSTHWTCSVMVLEPVTAPSACASRVRANRQSVVGRNWEKDWPSSRQPTWFLTGEILYTCISHAIAGLNNFDRKKVRTDGGRATALMSQRLLLIMLFCCKDLRNRLKVIRMINNSTSKEKKIT